MSKECGGSEGSSMMLDPRGCRPNEKSLIQQVIVLRDPMVWFHYHTTLGNHSSISEGLAVGKGSDSCARTMARRTGKQRTGLQEGIQSDRLGSSRASNVA